MVTTHRAILKYNLNQCTFYKCRSKKRIADKLMIGYQDLMSLCLALSDYYYSFDRPKKDGDTRAITASKTRLKCIQKRILRLLRDVERPDWLISGERGKSYITNAKSHLQSDYLLTMDIKKFYDNGKREYVYRFFVNRMKTSNDVARLLTDLVTYDGGIPTGCPTSQMIAYYAYEDMFLAIYQIAKEHNCLFTLYVDDMTFSSSVPFDPKKLTKMVDGTLRRFGHTLKHEKVKYYSKGVHKLVTGSVVSKHHTLEVPNRLRNKIHQQVRDVKTLIDNPDGLQNIESIKAIRSLRGRIQSAQNVDQRIFPEAKRLVDRAVDMIQG